MAGDERVRGGSGPEAGDEVASKVDPDAVTRLTNDGGDADEPSEGTGEEESNDPTVVRPVRSEPAREQDEVDVDAPTRVSDRSYERTPESADAPRPGGIRPGVVLFGEYEIEEVLGTGGMGEVYRARHRRLDESRAIKMMLAELSGKKGANEFFLREAKALLAVRNPAVVHCHDLLSDEQGRVFLIMEMIEGISLADRIDQGPLSPDDVLRLGARVASGLAAAHACGVVHRDVSPDNIVLPDGDVSRAKLIDFGIAKLLDQGQGTIVDGFKGKLSYASPEQLGFFGGRIDGRSDFYSLGLVLCAAALGRPLGMGRTVVEAVDARRQLQHVPDDIPAGLRSTIEPLLALDPDDRPEFVEHLFAIPGAAAGQSVVDTRKTRSIRSEKRPSRRWTPIAAAAALAAGIGGYLLLSGRPDLASTGPAGAPEPIAAVDPVPDVISKAPKPAPRPPTETVKIEQTARTQPASAVQPRERPKRRVTPLDRVRIMGLLKGANAALAENRLQSPKGDNAYEKYHSALEIDPDNTDAKRGLVKVAGRYLDLTGGALDSGDLEQARTYLGRAASIAPHHPRLPDVRDSVAQASSGAASGG